MGTRAAAQVAEKILDSISVQHLVVVGIAGGIGSSVAIAGLIVPELVIDLTTGAEYRPSVLGCTEARGTLATANKVFTDPVEAARLERQGVIAVDMETAAIAAICESRACPWSVFRAISDCVGDGSIDPALSSLARPDGEPDFLALVRFMMTRPNRIPNLIRLGRNLSLATNAAFSGAVRALGKVYGT
jgi:nucleoside phosphorylase